jgi:hypothetical protein
VKPAFDPFVLAPERAACQRPGPGKAQVCAASERQLGADPSRRPSHEGSGVERAASTGLAACVIRRRGLVPAVRGDAELRHDRAHAIDHMSARGAERPPWSSRDPSQIALGSRDSQIRCRRRPRSFVRSPARSPSGASLRAQGSHVGCFKGRWLVLVRCGSLSKPATSARRPVRNLSTLAALRAHSPFVAVGELELRTAAWTACGPEAEAVGIVLWIADVRQHWTGDYQSCCDHWPARCGQVVGVGEAGHIA